MGKLEKGAEAEPGAGGAGKEEGTPKGKVDPDAPLPAVPGNDDVKGCGAWAPTAKRGFAGMGMGMEEGAADMGKRGAVGWAPRVPSTPVAAVAAEAAPRAPSGAAGPGMISDSSGATCMRCVGTQQSAFKVVSKTLGPHIVVCYRSVSKWGGGWRWRQGVVT